MPVRRVQFVPDQNPFRQSLSAAGIIGALCAVCGMEPVFRYRDKVIIRVYWQPIFADVRHVFEQARCRLCGAIFTAEGR